MADNQDRGLRAPAQNAGDARTRLAEWSQDDLHLGQSVRFYEPVYRNPAEIRADVRDLLARGASAPEGRNQNPVAGVSGSPDETRRRIETIRENVSHIARGCRASTAHNPAPYLNSIEAALVALAGVGEHRPDQPQEKTLDSAASGALKELVDAAGPVVTEFSTASREDRWPAVKRSDLARLEQALSKASRSAVREQEA